MLDPLARTLTADGNGSSNSRPRTYSLARASEARHWRGVHGTSNCASIEGSTSLAAGVASDGRCGPLGGIDIAWVSGQVWSLMLHDDRDASAEVSTRMQSTGAMKNVCIKSIEYQGWSDEWEKLPTTHNSHFSFGLIIFTGDCGAHQFSYSLRGCSLNHRTATKATACCFHHRNSTIGGRGRNNSSVGGRSNSISFEYQRRQR